MRWLPQTMSWAGNDQVAVPPWETLLGPSQFVTPFDPAPTGGLEVSTSPSPRLTPPCRSTVPELNFLSVMVTRSHMHGPATNSPEEHLPFFGVLITIVNSHLVISKGHFQRVPGPPLGPSCLAMQGGWATWPCAVWIHRSDPMSRESAKRTDFVEVVMLSKF